MMPVGPSIQQNHFLRLHLSSFISDLISLYHLGNLIISLAVITQGLRTRFGTSILTFVLILTISSSIHL